MYIYNLCLKSFTVFLHIKLLYTCIKVIQTHPNGSVFFHVVCGIGKSNKLVINCLQINFTVHEGEVDA